MTATIHRLFREPPASPLEAATDTFKAAFLAVSARTGDDMALGFLAAYRAMHDAMVAEALANATRSLEAAR